MLRKSAHCGLFAVAVAVAGGAVGAQSPQPCQPSGTIDVGFELYRAVDPDRGDAGYQSAFSAGSPCDADMANHLSVVQTLFHHAFLNSNVKLNFESAVQFSTIADVDGDHQPDDCVAYTAVTGELALFTSTTARRLFRGTQRTMAIDTFKERMTAAGLYDKNTINVYYVWDEDISGLHVRKREGGSENLVFIGPGARPDTLAHEFAHAFSLEHVNFFGTQDVQNEYCVEYEYFDGECDFDEDNVMWVGRKENQDDLEERSVLYAGQRLRMVCNAHSALVANGDHAPNVVMDCPDGSMEGACPSLHP